MKRVYNKVIDVVYSFLRIVRAIYKLVINYYGVQYKIYGASFPVSRDRENGKNHGNAETDVPNY